MRAPTSLGLRCRRCPRRRIRPVAQRRPPQRCGRTTSPPQPRARSRRSPPRTLRRRTPHPAGQTPGRSRGRWLRHRPAAPPHRGPRRRSRPPSPHRQRSRQVNRHRCRRPRRASPSPTAQTSPRPARHKAPVRRSSAEPARGCRCRPTSPKAAVPTVGWWHRRRGPALGSTGRWLGRRPSGAAVSAPSRRNQGPRPAAGPLKSPTPAAAQHRSGRSRCRSRRRPRLPAPPTQPPSRRPQPTRSGHADGAGGSRGCSDQRSRLAASGRAAAGLLL